MEIGAIPVKEARTQRRVDNAREAVEIVVFVVVLVLLLKSFVAEAFVIPTGSMAETLLGHQKFVTCPECDYLFPVNASSEVDPSNGKIQRVGECVCPNCRKPIFLGSLPNYSPPDAAVTPDPGPTSGDRVLVAKFLYDLFGTLPHRHDVVVFKYPGYSYEQNGSEWRGNGYDPPFPVSGPFKSHVPINYIKRLIGLPGETIAICKGKLYVLPAGKGPNYDDLKGTEKGADETMLWQKPYMHVNDPAAVELFRKGKFQIVRKSPENVLAMKRLVYDNDHPARDVAAEARYRRWRAEEAKSWVDDEANGFGHTPGDREPTAWLRYHHRLRGSSGDEYITPFMGYNAGELRTAGNDWVGDLILECEASVTRARGEFLMELCKGPDRFTAQWNLADGFCTLVRVRNEKDGSVSRKELDSKKTGLTSGTHQVRFANVDQRLTVWVDGKLVFDDGVTYEVPEPAERDSRNDLQPASIGVRGASVGVKHLRLDHDTYYDAYKRESTSGPAVMTMYVQPDHFLCLGDNSFHSSDSRMWGLVPRRLMLGKALAVYYPFYFPWFPLSSQVNRVGLIH